MRINFRIIWLALPLVFGACSDSSDADTRPATETISVSVGSGPKIDIESEDKSRTQLGEDGVSVKWASDDQIALWAVNSRSETVFSKQAFKLYHYNTDYNTAKFRGDIPQMPADTYTYYAVSPVPSESDGTQATYLIPDVQDGGFNGDWDVMVADPVKAPALEKNDTGKTVQFQFRHKVHVLKIRIPKNDLGEKVSEITLAFPQPVTGRMTVDAADPDAAPTLTDGNKQQQRRKQGCAPAVRQGRHRMDGGSCGRGNREMYPKLLPVRRRRSRQGFIVCPLPGTYRLAARQRYQIRQNSQSPGFIRLRRRTGLLDDGQ